MRQVNRDLMNLLRKLSRKLKKHMKQLIKVKTANSGPDEAGEYGANEASE